MGGYGQRGGGSVGGYGQRGGGLMGGYGQRGGGGRGDFGQGRGLTRGQGDFGQRGRGVRRAFGRGPGVRGSPRGRGNRNSKEILSLAYGGSSIHGGKTWKEPSNTSSVGGDYDDGAHGDFRGNHGDDSYWSQSEWNEGEEEQGYDESSKPWQGSVRSSWRGGRGGRGVRRGRGRGRGRGREEYYQGHDSESFSDTPNQSWDSWTSQDNRQNWGPSSSHSACDSNTSHQSLTIPPARASLTSTSHSSSVHPSQSE